MQIGKNRVQLKYGKNVQSLTSVAEGDEAHICKWIHGDQKKEDWNL